MKLNQQRVRDVISALQRKPLPELRGGVKEDAKKLMSTVKLPLFRLGLTPDVRRALKEGKIDRFLRGAFLARAEPVSADAELRRLEARLWELHDGTNTYRLEISGKQLDCYYVGFSVTAFPVLDPRVYDGLPEYQKRHLYFMLIDVRNASRKPKVCDYLRSRRIHSFNLASDMDIIAVLLTTRNGLQDFYSRFVSEFGGETVCHSYFAGRPVYMEGRKIPQSKEVVLDGDLADPAILSKIQTAYGSRDLKDAYRRLVRADAIVGQSVMYDFARLGEIRDFALLFGVEDKDEPSLDRYDEVKCHIVDMYRLGYEHLGSSPGDKFSSFYSDARYLSFLKFQRTEERAAWEKMVGVAIPESNVFFFPISSVVHLESLATSDLEFTRRCEMYAGHTPTQIQLGTPMCNGDERAGAIAGLELASVNGHGFILGDSQFGKGATVHLIVDELVRAGIKVHYINAVQDDVDSLKKKHQAKVAIHSFDKWREEVTNLDVMKEQVHVYVVPAHGMKTPYDLSPIIDTIRGMVEVKTTLGTHMDQPGDRPLKHVLLLDEAHDFLAVETSGPDSACVRNKEALASVLQKMTHYGIALYLVIHKPSHLKIDEQRTLASDLHNRIVQRTTSEVTDAASLLAPDGKDYVYRLDKEIPSLPLGVAFLRFIDRKRDEMPPLKIRRTFGR